jgi:hypothetical protein
VTWRRPSLGFTAILATYGLTLAFFAWGLSPPPLDRVWQLHHELKIGRVYELEKEDLELLRSSMARYPALAAALLPRGQIGIVSANRDGWIDTPVITIIRTPRSGSTRRIVFDVQTPAAYIPYEIRVDGSNWQKKLTVSARGTLSLDLPPAPSQPEILTLKLKGEQLRADPSSLGVRVSFDPPEDPSAPAAEGDDEEEEDE